MKKFYTHLMMVVAILLLGSSAFGQVSSLVIDDPTPCFNGTVTISWSDDMTPNSSYTVKIGTGAVPNNTDLVNVGVYPTQSIQVSNFVGGVTYNVTVKGNDDNVTLTGTFTVDTRPTAPTAIAAAIDTVCNGATPMLDATGGTTGTNGMLSWYMADGTTHIGYGTPTSAAITMTTNFKVRRTDNVCGDSTALLSANIYVYANASAATDVTLNGSSNPLAVPCPGTYTLGQTGANLTGVSPLTTVQYSVVAATGPYITSYAFPAGMTTVYVRVTDGCSGTNYDYNEVVTMNSPSVNGAVAPNMASFCTGANITWTMTGQTLGTGATYQYSLNGTTWAATTSAGADPFWTINGLTSTTTVYLRIVSPCDTTAGVSATATAYVNPTDVSSVATSPNQSQFCSGTSVTFTATGGSLGTHPGSYYEYQVNGGGFVNNGSNPNYANAISTATTVDFRIYNGCTATSTTGASVSVTIATANVQPTSINITDINGGSICAGDTFDFQESMGTLSDYSGNPKAYYEFSLDNFVTTLEDSSLTGLFTYPIGGGATTGYIRITGGCGPQSPAATVMINPVASSLAPTSLEIWDMAVVTQFPADSEICPQTVTLVQIGGTADAGDGAAYDYGTINNGVFTPFGGMPTTMNQYTVAHSVDTTYAVRRNGGCSGTNTAVTLDMGTAEDNDVADAMLVMSGVPVADGDFLCGTATVQYIQTNTSAGDNANYQFEVYVDGNVLPSYTLNTGIMPMFTMTLDTIGMTSSVTVIGNLVGGCTDVSGTTFTHTINSYNGSSGFTAISNTNDNFCANLGVVATLKASGATVPANANIAWYKLDNLTNAIVAPVKITLGSTMGSDTIMVSPTVTTTYGARIEGCDTTVFEVRTVTVRDTSVAPTSVSISPGTLVCTGMPVSYSALGGAVGFGAIAHWYDSYGNSLGTGNPLFLNITQDTTVMVRYEGFCNNTVYTSGATVMVYDSNDVSVSMMGSVCPDTQLDLNSLVSPVGGSFAGTGVAGHYFTSSTPGVHYLEYTKTFPGGCAFTRQFTVTVNPSPAFTLSLQSTPTGCAATGSFLITGNPGDSYDVNSGDYTGTLDGAGEATITGTSGGYSVTVTSGLSCPTTDMITIPAAPGAVSATVDVTDETCFGSANGAIEVSASSGTSPYAYSIDGGAYGSSNVFENLAPGFYDISVKDDNGCTYTINNVEVEGVGSELDLTVNYYADLTCFGSNDGIIEDIYASGGSAPYEYSLNGDGFSTQTTFDNLAAGNYTITVKDANGCTADFSFSIEAPDQIEGVVSLLGYDANTNTYDVEITRTGGTGALLISLNGAPNTLDTEFNDLNPGVYNWTVTDDNGCTATGQFELEDPNNSIGDVTAAAEISVYPNPFANELTITGNLPANAKVVLMDSYGKQVSARMNVVAGKTVINTDNLAKGMYILNINGENLNVSRKLIKN